MGGRVQEKMGEPVREVTLSFIQHVFIQQCFNGISEKHKNKNKQNSSARACLQRSRVCCLGTGNNRRGRKVFLNKETSQWGLEGWLWGVPGMDMAWAKPQK